MVGFFFFFLLLLFKSSFNINIRYINLKFLVQFIFTSVYTCVTNTQKEIKDTFSRLFVTTLAYPKVCKDMFPPNNFMILLCTYKAMTTREMSAKAHDCP